MPSFPVIRSAYRGLRRFVLRVLGRAADSPRLLLEDLNHAAGRTLRLEELLVSIPNQICDAFQLRQFSIFVRRGSDYVLHSHRSETTVSLRASSAVVLQLKRERKLVFLQKDKPDGWMLLANPNDLQQLRALGAEALLPLPGRTGLIGFAALAYKRAGLPARQQAAQLEQLAAQIGLGLETAQFQQSLQDEATQRERVTRSLELAREVQERMLPQQLPAEPSLDTAAAYLSAEQVGGDYYDAFRTGSGKLCFVIADVSGKGTAAALLMATLRSTIRTAMLSEPPLPALLRIVNGQLYEASASSRYATLSILLYDPATGTLASSNAGHNPPLVLQAGKHRKLTFGGPVLGLLPSVAYEDEVLQLTPGETVVLYTDGVTEWTNEAGEEWGEAGLLAACASASSGTAEGVREHILAELKAFAGSSPQADDVTLLVLRATVIRAGTFAAPPPQPRGRTSLLPAGGHAWARKRHERVNGVHARREVSTDTDARPAGPLPLARKSD